MANRSLQVLKSWFEKGDKPTQEQFADLIDTLGAIRGSEECEGAVLQEGGNNQSISSTSMSIGKNTIAGLSGFYYKHIRFVSGGLANIYLSKTQVVPTITTGSEIKDTTIIPSEYYTKGDIISVINDSKYDNIAVINNMSPGMIQIAWVDGKAPFEAINEELSLDPEDYSIYCLSKPTKGEADLANGAFASGVGTKAINGSAHAEGGGTIAYGKFSHAEGRDTVANYASHAEGRDCKAIGQCAHAEGRRTQANHNNSHAEGIDTRADGFASHAEGSYDGTEYTIASGTASHAEGIGTKASGTASHAENKLTKASGSYSHAGGLKSESNGNNSIAHGQEAKTSNNGEAAFGSYNKSTGGSDNAQKTAFSIGGGTSSNRKNLFEVKFNGDCWITGVNEPLQNIVEKFNNRITELEDIIILNLRLPSVQSETDMPTDQAIEIYNLLKTLFTQQKYFIVNVYDDPTNRYLGNCAAIYEGKEGNDITLDGNSIAYNFSAFVYRYTFSPDGKYTRNMNSKQLTVTSIN